jgi:hypothetical protein
VPGMPCPASATAPPGPWRSNSSWMSSNIAAGWARAGAADERT